MKKKKKTQRKNQKNHSVSLPTRITYGLHRGDEHILNSLDMRLLKLNSDITDTQKVTKEKDYRSNLFKKKKTHKKTNFQATAVLDSNLSV